MRAFIGVLLLASVVVTAHYDPISSLPAYLNSTACKLGPSVPQTKYTGKVYVGRASFPDNLTAQELVARGAIVADPGNYLPFTLTKTLYSSDWLWKHDDLMYRYYTNCTHDAFEKQFIAMYDGVTREQIRDAYMGRQVVGVMGGWLLRDEPMYAECAALCFDLSAKGYVVVTGGGPGVMECCNLGSKMTVYGRAALDDAINILAKNPSYYVDAAQGYPAVKGVLAKYPNTTDLAFAVSDWTWPGHNFFCEKQAKLFDDWIREEWLLGMTTSGIIYFTDGETAGFQSQSVGTYFEVATQVLMQGASSERGTQFSSPMIFYGRPWLANRLYQNHMNQAQRRRTAMRSTTFDRDVFDAPNPLNHYSNKIFFADEASVVVDTIVNFTKEYYPEPKFNASRGRAPVYSFTPPPTKPAEPPTSSAEVSHKAAAMAAVTSAVTHSGMVLGMAGLHFESYLFPALLLHLAQRNWTATVVPSSYAVLARLNIDRMDDNNVIVSRQATVTAVMDDRFVSRLDVAFVEVAAATTSLAQAIVQLERESTSMVPIAIQLSAAKKRVAVGKWTNVTVDIPTAAVTLAVEVSVTSQATVAQQVEKHLGFSGVTVEKLIGPNNSPVNAPPVVTDDGNAVLQWTSWSASDNLSERLRTIPGVFGSSMLGAADLDLGIFGDASGQTHVIRPR